MQTISIILCCCSTTLCKTSSSVDLWFSSLSLNTLVVISPSHLWTTINLTFNLSVSRVTSLSVSWWSCRSLRFQKKSPTSLNPSKITMLRFVTTGSSWRWRCAACCWTAGRFPASISTRWIEKSPPWRCCDSWACGQKTLGQSGFIGYWSVIEHQAPSGLIHVGWYQLWSVTGV